MICSYCGVESDFACMDGMTASTEWKALAEQAGKALRVNVDHFITGDGDPMEVARAFANALAALREAGLEV